MVRNVRSPLPEDITEKNPGDAGRLEYLRQIGPAVRELLGMMRNSASYADLDEKAAETKAAATQEATASAMAAVPSSSSIAQAASTEAGKVVSRRVASAVNASAVTVPGLGTVDVVLTLTPPLLDGNYVPVAGVPMTNTTTLLGLVSILGVTARTASTMTVRLRNTGASAAVVPAGAITAAAVHPTAT